MIELILAGIFVFFLPGFLLVNAVFPRRGELDLEYDLLLRIALGVVMSVVVVVTVGFILNSLTQDFGLTQAGGKGFVTSEYLWAIMILLSVLLFFVGWLRGAYPFMGRIHPSLLRRPKREPQSVLVDLKEDREFVEELKNLAKRREELRLKVGDCERRIRQGTGKIRESYQQKKDLALAELKDVDERLKEIEERRAQELI